MRSISIAILLFALVSYTSQLTAQDGKKTLLQTEQMAVKLGLSDKQKVELDKQLRANQESRKAQMEKIRALREEIRRDAFVERQAQMERMKKILTPEQWEKYLQSEKVRRKETANRRLQRFRGQYGRANQRTGRDFFGRPQSGKGKMMLRKRIIQKKAQDKKENSGDGGN